MVRILQALTVLALISAGAVFVLCAGQWLQGASGSEQIERNLDCRQTSLGPGVVERFRYAGSGSEKKRSADTFGACQAGRGLCLVSQSPTDIWGHHTYLGISGDTRISGDTIHI